MIYTSHITNEQRFKFMLNLCTDVFGQNGLLVEDWERRFISSFRSSSRPSLWFIGKRLEYTDRLWRKYGVEIKFPFPMPPRTTSAIPTAEADCCDYLVKGASRWMEPCGAPATKINSRGFCYCDEHGELAQKAIKRRGGHMELRTYVPKITI